LPNFTDFVKWNKRKPAKSTEYKSTKAVDITANPQTKQFTSIVYIQHSKQIPSAKRRQEKRHNCTDFVKQNEKACKRVQTTNRQSSWYTSYWQQLTAN